MEDKHIHIVNDVNVDAEQTIDENNGMNIIVTSAENKAIDAMEWGRDKDSDTLTNVMNDTDGMELCAQIAEMSMLMQQDADLLSVDTQQALSSFHAKCQLKRKQMKWKYLVWSSVAASVLLVAAWAAIHHFPSVENIEIFHASSAPQLLTLQVNENEKAEPLPKAMQSLSSSEVCLSSRTITYLPTASQIKKNTKQVQKVQIHRLSIPRGETFKVVLSDGTEVLLNADTRLSYPTVFKGTKRIVSLEGEAYFKVAKDVNRPFIVYSGGMQVKVLGTEFNIRNYASEHPCVTLIEGKVAVSDTCELKSLEMKPGQSVQLVADGSLQVEEVDTESLLYWKEGYFYFDDVTLEEMMKDIGRWYNIGVTFRNSEIMNLRMHFLAKRDQNLSELVEHLNRMQSIHVFIEDEQLIIE